MIQTYKYNTLEENNFSHENSSLSSWSLFIYFIE
jgi:hypothetical protein